MNQPANLGDTGSWRGVFMEWVNEWPQLLGGCNWYTYHLVMIEFEDDRIMGAVECTFIILGLGFRARWNYKVTERVAFLQEAISEIQAGTAATRPLNEFLSELKDEK